jgi:ABC-type dipeptide/oligopeptide/nickel transport system permease subunit
VFRGAAKELLQRDFLAAARLAGAGPWRLLTRHVWPNLRPLAAVWLALLVAAAALAEVGLAIVGLGLPQPLPTWGNMLAPLKDIFLMRDWWLYAPLVCLVPLLTCLNLHAGAQARQSRG